MPHRKRSHHFLLRVPDAADPAAVRGGGVARLALEGPRHWVVVEDLVLPAEARDLARVRRCDDVLRSAVSKILPMHKQELIAALVLSQRDNCGV